MADWLHRSVAGLAPAAPGYRRLSMRPTPGGGLTHARARHHTPYGPAECAWAIAGGQIMVDVVVPPNTSASVTLPGRDTPIEVGSGAHHWAIEYHEPRVLRAPLSLESTLADLLDDRDGWARVRAIIVRHQPELAAQIEGRSGISGTGELTLGQVLAMRPNTGALELDLIAGFDEIEGSH